MIMLRTLDRFKSRWGLATILTVSIGATIALMIASITWLDINTARSSSHTQLEQRGLRLVSTLEDVVADPLYFSDVDALGDIARSVSSQPDLVYVRVFKPDGHLLVAEQSSKYPAGSMTEAIPAEAIHNMDTTLTFIGDDLDVVGPIEAGPEIIGMVQLRYSGETLRAEIHDIILRHVWQGLILVAVGMGLAYLIARYAAKPVHNLVRATRQIGGGNLSSAIPVGGTSETAERRRPRRHAKPATDDLLGAGAAGRSTHQGVGTRPRGPSDTGRRAPAYRGPARPAPGGGKRQPKAVASPFRPAGGGPGDGTPPPGQGASRRDRSASDGTQAVPGVGLSSPVRLRASDPRPSPVGGGRPHCQGQEPDVGP